MKKFTLFVIVSLLFTLVTVIAMTATNITPEQSNPADDTEIQTNNEYLVGSFEGYVLIAPYNGEVYVIRGPELEVFISNTTTFGNTACNEAFPLSYENYYRVVSAESDTHIIHMNDLETFCS